MSDSTTPDISVPPTALDVKSELTADTSSQAQQADTIQTFPFPYCLLWNSQPWQSITIYAPDVPSADLTARQYAALLSDVAQNQFHYPPNMITVRAGSC